MMLMAAVAEAAAVQEPADSIRMDQDAIDVEFFRIIRRSFPCTATCSAPPSPPVSVAVCLPRAVVAVCGVGGRTGRVRVRSPPGR